MALPTSGQLSVGDIYYEINGSTPQGDGVSASLSNMAYSAGFTPPQEISDFYGYSSYTPIYANVFGGTIQYSNEGTRSYEISCYNRKTGAPSWSFGSTWSATGTYTSVSPTTWQDYDTSTPSSFVVNDDGQNYIYIYRTIAAFNAATITVNLQRPASFPTGNFTAVSYQTYNGTVTSYNPTSTNIQLTLTTSGGSLTNHWVKIYFTL